MTDVIPTHSYEPTIDIAAAAQLLRRVEETHDRQGWHPHSNTHVYVVYDLADVVTASHITQTMGKLGAAITNSRYGAQPFLTFAELHAGWIMSGMQPPKALLNFATNAALTGKAEPDADVDSDLWRQMVDMSEDFRKLIQVPGICGFMACHEGWSVPDRPGFRGWDGESRVASLVDVHGRVHEAIRRRGESATLILDSGAALVEIQALKLLVDLSQNRAPDNVAEVEARYRPRCAHHHT